MFLLKKWNTSFVIMLQQPHLLTNSPSSKDTERERETKMGDDGVKNEAMEILGLFQLLPRLVVFDLDYTLWPFYWYFTCYFP